jgi:predicted ATP-grasp superfamily ATP-dependent carboligase
VHDDGHWLQAVTRATARVPGSNILPVDAWDVRFAARHQDRLARLGPVAPVPTVEAFDTVNDKWSLAQRLAGLGLPHPPTILLESGPAFERALHDLPFPVLFKPIRGSYGYGILRFEEPEAVIGFLQDRPGFAGRYVVQSYITGTDIDCSVLCRDGEILAHTIQEGFLPATSPFGSPAGIRFLDDPPVLDVVARLMAALRFNGVAHVDMRYDDRGGPPLVIEVNPRFWGSVLGSLAAGVNFPYLACLAGRGVSFASPAVRNTKFVHGGAVARQWLGRLRGGPRPTFSMTETSLRYSLADPGPELVESIRAGARSMRARLRRIGRALSRPEDGGSRSRDAVPGRPEQLAAQPRPG